jgi:hypothetical protein
MKMIAHEQSGQRYPVNKKGWGVRKKEWRWRIWLAILGIEIPLIGGFWVWNNDPWYYVLFLSVPLGAVLLRSWWALLIVPVVFAIGIALGILLLPFLQGGWPAVQNRLEGGLEGVDILLFLGTPAIIGLTALGTALGVVWGKGIKHSREH